MKSNYLVILPHQRTSTVSLKKFLFGWSEVNMIRQITSEQANYAARVKSDNPFGGKASQQNQRIREVSSDTVSVFVYYCTSIRPPAQTYI